jgi:glucokinase
MRIKNRKYLGVDIGGTSVKYAIVDSSGQIYSQSSFETGSDMTKEQFLFEFDKVIEDSLKERIKGIGICSLGFINSVTSDIVCGVENLPFLKNVNFEKYIAQQFRFHHVKVINDANSAALGEGWLGAGKDCSAFFMMTLGTGVGGAIVIDSKIVDGVNFRAGEIAYLDYADKDNYFEKFVSTKQVIELAAKKLEIDDLDGVAFFNKVKEGDEICNAILSDWMLNISKIIANIIVLLDPKKIIIGGGVSKQEDIIIPKLKANVRRMLPPSFQGQYDICMAKMNNKAGCLGAVSQFVSKGI